MKIIKNFELISFSELMLWNNKNISEIALLCGKSERTIRVKTWIDWKIRNGELIAPSGECFTSRHLTILPILHQWRREIETNKNNSKIITLKEIKKK